MPGSWSDFLKLRSGPAPPPSSEAGAVRVYADSDGALRSVQSDGTDAAVGGGSTPVTESGSYLQDGTTNIANNGNAYLQFDELAAGDDILDLSVPAAPTVKKAGLITVQAQVFAAPFTTGGLCTALLILDSTGSAIQLANNGVSNGVEMGVEVAGSWVLAAGDTIRLRVYNSDGVEARDFQLLNSVVSRIGPA